jgi:hypothetical protein
MDCTGNAQMRDKQCADDFRDVLPECANFRNRTVAKDRAQAVDILPFGQAKSGISGSTAFETSMCCDVYVPHGLSIASLLISENQLLGDMTIMCLAAPHLQAPMWN